MNKMTRLASMLAMTALLLTGCDNAKKETNVEYLAVQMSRGDNWSIVDKNGKEVVKEEYPPESQFSHISINDGVFWVKQEDKWQLFSISQPKKPLLDEEFQWVTDFNCSRAVVSNPNQPIRIIDAKGKVVARLTKEVRACSVFMNSGYATFITQGHKYGIINKNGEVVLRAEYDFVYHINKDFIIVRKNSDDTRLLIINFKGQRMGEIDEDKYNFISVDEDGHILVSDKNNDVGPFIILDKRGKKQFELRKSVWRWGACYKDGYLVFGNEDSKFGVADDKGEILIRTKYSSMQTLGQGHFAAMKNGKCGIVNYKDETIVDFDFTNAANYKVGELFLMQDGSSWSLIGKDGKEIIGFDNCVQSSQADVFVKYVDIDRLTDGIIKAIEDLEQPLSAAQVAKKHNLSLDDYHYRSSVVVSMNINDDIMSGNCIRYYNRSLAEERTHTEKVDDGWVTTTKTISDGYHWSAAVPQTATASLTLNSETGVDIGMLRKAVTDRLRSNHKFENGEFIRSVNFEKQGVQVETALEWNPEYISIRVSYFIKGQAAPSQPMIDEAESDTAVAVW